MAITANTEWEVLAQGDLRNGGGFDPTIANAGTNYTLQASAQVDLVDVVSTGASTITSAAGLFTSALIGNCAWLSGGSNSLPNTWRQIIAFTDVNTITLDASVPSGTAILMRVGGAINSIDLVANSGSGLSVAGNYVFVNYSSGVTISSSGNIALGKGSDNTTGRFFSIIGYDGTLATRNRFSLISNYPTLINRGVGVYFISANSISHGTLSRNIIFDCNFTGYGVAAMGINSSNWEYCKALKASSQACWSANSNHYFICCYAECYSGSTAFTNSALCYKCIAKVQDSIAFQGIGAYIECIAIGIGSGLNSTGFGLTFSNGAIGCIAYNLRTGFAVSTIRAGFNSNNIASTCATGFSYSSTTWNPTYAGATFNCQVSVSNNPASTVFFSGNGAQSLPVICTVDPFVNAASGDFTLNNVSGGGALLRNQGFARFFDPQLNSYIDIGAVGHEDSGSSSTGGISRGRII